MRPPREFQNLWVEALRAEGDPRDARGDERVELRAVERARVHLRGDLGVGVDAEARVQGGEDAAEQIGGDERGRAPAEEHRAERMRRGEARGGVGIGIGIGGGIGAAGSSAAALRFFRAARRRFGRASRSTGRREGRGGDLAARALAPGRAAHDRQHRIRAARRAQRLLHGRSQQGQTVLQPARLRCQQTVSLTSFLATLDQ